MYAEILDRNKNDCSLSIYLVKDQFIKQNDSPDKIIKANPESIAKEIIRCHKESKGKKAVVIPLGFKNKKGGSHANALVFNTLQMTAEHFEPHGLKDYSPSKKDWLELKGINLAGAINVLNKEIKKLAQADNLKEFSKGLKYLKPVDVCPNESMYKNFRGVQGLDRSKKEPVNFEGFTIKEFGGYCDLWTYFLLELRLKTLDKPAQAVLKEYATYRDQYKISIGSDPNKSMMGLIRGYSKVYFNMIRKLINDGKFTLEEFITYRDFNKILKNWKNMTNAERASVNNTHYKLNDILFEEASKRIVNVMK